MSEAVILRMRNIVKRFGGFTALRGIDLDVHDGELLTIVGPSGSGKTTLIRLLVGMDAPTEGTIHLNGKLINDVPANRRPTCMVFQSLALFPHRSVGQNIEFPLKVRGVAAAERRKQALELLDLLRLPRDYYDKSVTQCSGGERQRVALARSLAFDPEILFFDEPLSALDYRLRKVLEKELKDLQRRTRKTFVYITHSLEEAMVLSDRIAIMHNGRLIQVGTADEIYSTPQSRFAAEFMGEVNLFDVVGTPERRLTPLLDAMRIDGEAMDIEPAERATLMVRPEFVSFLSPGDSADCVVAGTVHEEFAFGSRIQYEVHIGSGQQVTVEKLREDRFTGAIRDDVVLGWDLSKCHLIRRAGEL